jgi:TRAP-type C4-dicarboxylate transport system substrate-binding protein
MTTPTAAAHRRRRALPAAAALLMLLAGCSTADGSASPAGSPTAPSDDVITLTLGTDDSPGVPSADEITRFAEEVAERSDGRLAIEPRWHAVEDPGTDWDQQIAALVQDGSLDLALGPTWAWDVASLKTLQSPFLVDSDALVKSIITDDDLSASVMSGLTDEGVTGLALWPEGLRHPFGFDGPLAEVADYRGATIRSPKSSVSKDVFAALGAQVSAQHPDAITMAGVQGEYLLKPNGVGVGNVTFFPKVNVLYAGTDVLEGLSAQDQDTLREAAAATRDWALDHVPGDVAAGKVFCEDGGAIVHATEAQVAELVRATAPVADAIAESPGNADLVARISELKAALPDARAGSPLRGDGPVHGRPECGGVGAQRHLPVHDHSAGPDRRGHPARPGGQERGRRDVRAP